MSNERATRRVAQPKNELPYTSGADARIVAEEPAPPPVEETTAADRGEPAEEPPLAETPMVPNADALPTWAKIPTGFRFPRGTTPIFVMFRAAWTSAPFKGDRTAILWELTDLDELEAYRRAAGLQIRASHELAKGMIRSIDGHPADWSGLDGPGSVEAFWREIGPKCRDRLIQMYAQRHVMDAKDRADFFTNCVAVRAVG